MLVASMHGGNSSKSNEDLLNLNAISLDLVGSQMISEK